MSDMKTSKAGTEMIKQHEGLRLKAYVCPAGVWTIGWGHTRQVRSGQKITLERAQEFLAKDIANAEKCVRERVKVDLTQGQFDALVSFVFNLGCPALGRSTLLKHVNHEFHDLAVEEFPRWNKGGGRVLKGLKRRRSDEAMHYQRRDL